MTNDLNRLSQELRARAAILKDAIDQLDDLTGHLGSEDRADLSVMLRAADALSQAAAQRKEWRWRDMNSAPYDKTTVALIALRSDASWKTGVGWYQPLNGWQGFDERPTHWAPLPPFDQSPETQELEMAGSGTLK